RHVELLRVEAEGRRDQQQPLHQVTRLLQVAGDRQGRNEPERAGEEGAFLTGEAVVCLLGEVPQHEAVLGEPVRDRRDGGAQALVLAGKEAEDRRQQRRGVEGLGLVVLAQDASGGAVLEDVPADLLGGRVPRLLPLAAACDCTIGQRRLGSRWLLRVWRRIESSTAPKTSFWRWSNAPLPTRTGRAPA